VLADVFRDDEGHAGKDTRTRPKTQTLQSAWDISVFGEPFLLSPRSGSA
jgi:hypothetical protein